MTVSPLLRRALGRWRALSTAAPGPELPPLPLAPTTLAVWGANTAVGKTLFSTGLAAAALRAGQPLLYLKPVQTGFPADSDARLVAAAATGHPGAETCGPHAAALLGAAGGSEAGHAGRNAVFKTLYAWRDPVSPHVAVAAEGRGVGDGEVAAAVARHLADFGAGKAEGEPCLALVETAGGVGSPGPSGRLQADAMRTLRLPALLVGDGRLGGISATLTAWESLVARGYDVPLIALMDPGGHNAAAVAAHVAGGGTAVRAFPACRPPPEGAHPADGVDQHLREWLAATERGFNELLGEAHAAAATRLAALRGAAAEARQIFWWPFTQHGHLKPDDPGAITVVDARAGENYAVFEEGGGGGGGPALRLRYDACASWWTQGVSVEAAPALSRAIGAAAARYGHVIFPQTAHAPALELAREAVAGVGRGWAARAFFTDNGSTAVEVALKMAFRKFAADRGLVAEAAPPGTAAAAFPEFGVMGLQEAYHGDTLGAMDAVAPSAFNGPWQTPWFRGRGVFLDPPTLGLKDGAWRVAVPVSWGEGAEPGLETFEHLDAAFDGAARAGGGLAGVYRAHVDAQLDANPQVAAAIMEPVVQGAGGMRLIDPEFQRAVAAGCAARGVPLILDEVFTGFWRLGAPSAAQLLGIQPDIACYAKLLTGGAVPLALTLATDAVFRAFEGDSKAYALLHGHSYTAHPLGCAAAVQALRTFSDPGVNRNLTPAGRLAPLWDGARLDALSRRPDVERVVALGTLLAVELRAGGSGGGGYASNAAAGAVAALRRAGVQARPLGNVVYVMVTPMTAPERCTALMDALAAALDGR